jgi:hypothetical protein
VTGSRTRQRWAELVSFLDFDVEVRRVICSANGFHDRGVTVGVAAAPGWRLRDPSCWEVIVRAQRQVRTMRRLSMVCDGPLHHPPEAVCRLTPVRPVNGFAEPCLRTRVDQIA